MRHQPIFRIDRNGFCIRRRGELIDARQNDLPGESFDRPVVLDELAGEMIEQFRVGRRFTGGAEIVGGADDAGTGEPMPHAVGGHAGGEGIFRRGEPLCQFQPTAFGGRDDRCALHRDDPQKTARRAFPERVYAAANMNRFIADLFALADGNNRLSLRPGIDQLL